MELTSILSSTFQSLDVLDTNEWVQLGSAVFIYSNRCFEFFTYAIEVWNNDDDYRYSGTLVKGFCGEIKSIEIFK